MLTTPTRPRAKRKSRGATLFPGIVEAARSFGVDRITLYRVLKGQFPDNQRLAARYAAFVKGAAK